MIGKLSIGLSPEKTSVNTTIGYIQTEFEKAGKNIEKNLNSGAEKGLKKIGEESKKTVNNIAGLNNKLDILRNKLKFSEIGSKEFRNLQKEIQKTEKDLSKFSGAASGLGGIIKGAFSVFAVKEFGAAVFNLTSKNQQLENSFVTLLGSQEKARDILSQIQGLADQSPFEKFDLADQTKKLIGYGFAGENAVNIMQVLGNTVSALGGGKDTLDGLVLALGQIQAKGRLSQEELNQFAERGVPAIAILTEKLGLTEEQLQNIGAEGIKASEAIPALLLGLQEKYLGALEKQSQTLTGRLSTITDQAKNELASFGDDVIDTQKQILDGVGKVVEDDLPIILGGVSGIINSITELVRTIADSINTAFSLLSGKVEESISTQLTLLNRLSIGVSFLGNGFALLIDIVTAVFSSVAAGLKDIFLNIKVFGENAYRLFYNLGINAGRAFDNIPFYAKTGLNALLEAVSSTVNKAIGLLNKLPKVNIIPVQFTPIDTGLKVNYVDFTSGFKELPGFVNKTRTDIVSLNNVLTNNEKRFQKLADNIGEIGKETKKSFNLDTLDGLGESINSKRKELKEMKIGSEEFIAKQKEITGLEEKFRGSIYTTNDAIKTLGNTSSGTTKKIKEDTKDLQNQVKELEKEYGSYDKKIEKLADDNEKYIESSRKYQNELVDGIQKATNSLKEQANQYEKNIQLIEDERAKKLGDENKNTAEKIAERVLEIEKQKLELEQELKTMEQDKDRYLDENFQKEKVRREELKKLTDEYTEALKIVNQEVLATARTYDTSSELGKILIDQTSKIKEINDDQNKEKDKALEKYNDEKAKIEETQRVYEAFLKQKELTLQEFNSIRADERFLALTQEQQDLITKLAEEKIALTNQRDAVIALETEVQNAKIALSNNTTAVLRADVMSLDAEYKKLIGSIQKAITEQNKLNAAKGGVKYTQGYVDGGYTGDGGKYDVAGVVHKGEYVIPQAVINRIPQIVPQMEMLRTGGTQASSSVQNNSYNKSISIPQIIVQNEIDFVRAFDKIKFRM